MVYKKNFVAAIKVGGQVLRESNDRVELPFGSEYSILLKNLDSVRMQAQATIDGKKATGWLVIDPNWDVEIERFVEDMDRGNRFKFIERTESVERHRGIEAEDGLIRIEFKREKVYELPKVVEHHTYHHHYPGGCFPWPYRYSGPIYYSATSTTGSLLGGITRSSASGGIQAAVQSAQNVNCTLNANFVKNDAGITVPGSISEQKFHYVPDFATEKSEALVLHLVGKTQAGPVKLAKTVKTKIQCETCGKKNKSLAKFCIECGTSLERV